MTIFSACFSAASVKVTVKVYKNDMEQNLKKYIRILMFFSTGNATILYINWTIYQFKYDCIIIRRIYETLFHRLFCFINEIAFVLMNLLRKKNYTIQRTFHDIQKLGHELLYRDLCPFWTWGSRWALGSRWTSFAPLKIDRTSRLMAHE